MDVGGSRQGSESLDSDEPAPPGTSGIEHVKKMDSPSTSSASPVLVSSKGVENAKKRLRAFSIQKKAPLAPVSAVKPVSTGSTTVLIGKLSGVRVTPKVEKPEDEAKKIPKPPKPGGNKYMQESYVEVQKKTLSEIEDMKRKMELVELGIPLGLICPSVSALPVKAMPTKAMPPIKTFLERSYRVVDVQCYLDKSTRKERAREKITHSNHREHSAKVDEIIREARKAKAEGREFKFDYHKFVPDYDNPFQRKKDTTDQGAEQKEEKKEEDSRKGKGERNWDKSKRPSERFERRHDFRKDMKDRYRDRDKRESKDRSKDRDGRSKERDARDEMHKKDDNREDIRIEKSDSRKDKDEKRSERKKNKDESRKDKDDKNRGDKKETVKKNNDTPQEKGTDVDLNDFLVCDSWSLEAEDKNISPKEDEKSKKPPLKILDIDPLEQLRQSLGKNKKTDNLKPKVEKLKPVVDSFEYEIDPNDDEILDIFDEDSTLEKYSTKTKPKKDSSYGSPVSMKFNESNDADDPFLESVINEIKQEEMSDDDGKGLVEYDESPSRDSKEGSQTPELQDSMRSQSQKSDYSDGYRSTESRKSTESGYKSSESVLKPSKRSPELRLSVEKDIEDVDSKMTKDIVESLEMWSFVLKICQPLLFRHDRNKCYKETRIMPKLWYTQNPKLCNCVKDRSVVYSELEACKMDLIDRLYSRDQLQESPAMQARTWYPRVEKSLLESPPDISVSMQNEWEDEGPLDPPVNRRGSTPKQEESLDKEYQRFMEAVSWPEIEPKQPSRSTTPVQNEETKKKEDREDKEDKKKAKKIKLVNDNWSQESEIEEEKPKPPRVEKVKEKRKRKHLSSTSSVTDSERSAKKKKKSNKKKEAKKAKSKAAKRRKLQKKVLKKLKDKKKKKKIETIEDSDFEVEPEKDKKKEKKVKKKKQRLKKKAEKKKKRAKSSSYSESSSSSDSSSDSESDSDRKIKKKKKEIEVKKKKEKKKKRKQSTSTSPSEESERSSLFDVNVLNNIKTERLTDDERKREVSPSRRREIISVKELHDEFNTVQVKQEAEEESKRASREEKQPIEKEELPIEEEKQPIEKEQQPIGKEKQPIGEEKQSIGEQKQPVGEEKQSIGEEKQSIGKEKQSIGEEKQSIGKEKPLIEEETIITEEEKSAESMETEVESESAEGEIEINRFNLGDESYSGDRTDKVEFKEPQVPTPPPRVDDASQCSSQTSQDSVISVKTYEKDESHLRPSSQNSNYSFNDVMANQTTYNKMDDAEYDHYDMYEHMAMAYQSDVASQVGPCAGAQRIETVVRARARGEITCDWRPGAGGPRAPAPDSERPSRWGLKPGDVNIVLTGGSGGSDGGAGGGSGGPPSPRPAPVYRIQSLANRSDNSISYDEAYMDTYGASDRLQYGDCFSTATDVDGGDVDSGDVGGDVRTDVPRNSLMDRINRVLSESALGEVAKEENEKDTPDKGILVMKSLTDSRGVKRVSFADGYKPGQDSDVEEPPLKKRKKPRRVGCAWPCPASHPDHVPLWDALPPPPPPAGSPPRSPPPPAAPRPPAHALRLQHQHQRQRHALLPTPVHHQHKFDPSVSIPNFMPPEPPPGLITFP